MSLQHIIRGTGHVTPFDVEFKSVLLATPSGPAGLIAGPYTVGIGGRFQTIQAAIDQAVIDLPVFVEILVTGQIYTENIVVPATLTNVSITGIGLVNLQGNFMLNGASGTTVIMSGFNIAPPTGSDCVIINGGLLIAMNVILSPDNADAAHVAGVIPGQGLSLGLINSVITGSPIRCINQDAVGATTLLQNNILSNFTSTGFRVRDGMLLVFGATCLPSGGSLSDVDNSFVLLHNLFSIGGAALNIATGMLSLSNCSVDSGASPAITATGAATLSVVSSTLMTSAAPFAIAGNPLASMGYALIVFPGSFAVDPAITLTPFTVM